MRLNGHVVIVTGAAGTIGSELCREIAREGGVPVVTDINGPAAHLLAEEIRALGLLAHSSPLDMTDTHAIDALIAEVRSSWGRLDAVVNNAYPRSPHYGRELEDVEYADFCAALDVHLGGYFLVSQRVARDMRLHGGGSIVNVASIYGLFAPDFSLYEGVDKTMPVEYAAIKGGVVSLTRYFASYYLKQGVRCNAVAPGGIRAEDQPAEFVRRYDARAGQRGLLEPGDVAGVVTFLVSDAARHMTGQVLVVDDGWSL